MSPLAIVGITIASIAGLTTVVATITKIFLSCFKAKDSTADAERQIASSSEVHHPPGYGQASSAAQAQPPDGTSQSAFTPHASAESANQQGTSPAQQAPSSNADQRQHLTSNFMGNFAGAQNVRTVQVTGSGNVIRQGNTTNVYGF